jgi:hypothetical protein
LSGRIDVLVLGYAFSVWTGYRRSCKDSVKDVKTGAMR